MSDIGLQFRADLAGLIEEELVPELLQKMPPLDQILQSAPARQARFARQGFGYFMSVIGFFFARKEGRFQAKTKDEVRNEIIQRVSHQLSTQLSKGIVDLTITNVTEVTSPAGASQERVEEKFALHQKRREEADIVILFDEREITRFKLTLQVKVDLLIKKIIILIQKIPSPKIQSLSLQDAEADLTFSDDKGRFSAELKIPIQGELNL